MSPWIGWLQLVAEEAVLVVALLVVFDGCRRLVQGGVSSRPALTVAIALILPVADAALSLNVVKTVRSLQADKMAAIALHGREPAGGWEKAASTPAQRTAMSTESATVAYLFQGMRADVVDAQGARVAFVPTAQQGLQRDQFVRDEKAAEDSAQAAYERGIRLFIETGVFMLAGLTVGWRRRRA